MGYHETVGIAHSELFSRHDAADRFMPLSEIKEFGTNEAAARLRSTVTSHFPFSPSAVDMMDYAFGKVLDNVLQHSDAIVPGLACSRHYVRGNYVEVCIVDCGIDIQQSMLRNPSYAGLSDSDLLIEAFDAETGEYYGTLDYGTSHVSGGMGLCMAANAVRALSGYIWLFGSLCG